MYHLRLARLFFATWLASFRPRRHGERKILFLSSGKLGDLVCKTSVVGAIGRQLKTSVDVVTNRFGPELYAGNPNIGNIWVFNDTTPGKLAAAGYTHAVILNPNPALVALAVRAGIPYRIGITTPREQFWTRLFERFLQERHVYYYDRQVLEFYQTMLESLGVKPEPERRELFPSAADRQRAEQFWQEHGLVSQFIVGMCLGAGKPYKLWPMERFAAVADYVVKKYGAKIILVGGTQDLAYSHELARLVKYKDAIVDATGKFKLLEQAALLEPCQLFVSVDTGPLYIADTMGVPIVDIAGPADCVSQHPIGRYIILHPADKEQYGDMAVSFHSGSENEERYKQMTEAITVGQVTDAINELIRKNS